MQQLRFLSLWLPEGAVLLQLGRLCRQDLAEGWLAGEDIMILAVLCWLRGLPELPAPGGDAGALAEWMVRLLISCGPGLLVLGASTLTRGAIGRGDGLVLCSLGLRQEPGQIWSICQLSFLLSGLWALGMISGRGRRREERELPFLPFLTPAVILVVTKGGW